MTLPALRTVGPGELLPFEPDLIVREEDTWLVLGRRPETPIEPQEEDVETLLRDAADVEARAPGSVVDRGGDPPELAAVVHDLDREPSCCPAWVDAALEAVMEEIHARGARRVVLPLLGGMHGTLPPLRFYRSARGALERISPWALETVCLRIPPDVDPRAVRDIERLWREDPSSGSPGGEV